MPNIVSVSFGDHIDFGEGDGKLATPSALEHRLPIWKKELSADTIHWRIPRHHLPGTCLSAQGHHHPIAKRAKKDLWDDLLIAPQLAHANGMKIYAYVSIFDEGWPLPNKREREKSFHNKECGQHVSWQSNFTREHQRMLRCDKSGKTRHWGVPCLSYEFVRSTLRTRLLNIVLNGEFDGLFICLRSQSRPAEHADQFGFNDPIAVDYSIKYGHDIRYQEYDVQKWRDFDGKYLTIFLQEMRTELKYFNKKLGVGCARGDILGPPLGNTSLDWPTWIKKDLIDQLIINQNSSVCPSTWLDLWPMHRGNGYLQNYLTSENMPVLDEQIENTYAPVLKNKKANLYIARQWNERNELEENNLTQNKNVSGLVFSSFRHDNPQVVARNKWKV